MVLSVTAYLWDCPWLLLPWLPTYGIARDWLPVVLSMTAFLWYCTWLSTCDIIHDCLWDCTWLPARGFALTALLWHSSWLSTCCIDHDFLPVILPITSHLWHCPWLSIYGTWLPFCSITHGWLSTVPAVLTMTACGLVHDTLSVVLSMTAYLWYVPAQPVRHLCPGLPCSPPLVCSEQIILESAS